MNILLLEDDPVLGNIICDYLSEVYLVDHAFNSQETAHLLDSNRYDLLIFDINVPGQSGIELIRELRQYHNTTPAIIITAYEDVKHLKDSFNAGAHDYIKKPFDLEELKLRIEKIKKIFNIEQEEIERISKSISYCFQDRVIINGKSRIALKPKEAQLFEYFLSHPNKIISIEEIIQNLWTYEEMPIDATIRSHIRNLRSVIGNDKIKTLRGLGYRYDKT